MTDTRPALPMKPYYSDDHVTVCHGDCLEVLATLPDASVDSVVTDPPYGLEFMGKDWDSFKSTGSSSLLHSPKDEGRTFTNESGHMWDNTKALPRFPGAGKPFQDWCEAWARECLRVLKPGGHMLAFGGSRTWHRLAAAVEDAGFEVRDSIAWLYGSGFPKSLDVSKAIDKAAGAEREVSGQRGNTQCGYLDRGGVCPGHDDAGQSMSGATVHRLPTAPATPDAERWQGWGTALKPAFEPIVVARKPLIGTVAANVLEHGTGALNIDGCRIGDGSESQGLRPSHEASAATRYTNQGGTNFAATPGPRGGSPAGRWPTNVVLDDSQAAELDRQSGVLHSQDPATRTSKSQRVGVTEMGTGQSIEYADQGGASRFFPTFRYEAKAPTSERPRVDGIAHPTVKPLALMRWLVRLVTPPGGTVLEPFAGSGTTAEACVLEGFQCIAIEREPDYLPLIVSRLSKPMQLGLDFGSAS